MENGLSWSNLVVAVVAPIAITVIWAWKIGKSPQIFSKAMWASRISEPAYELMPARWFHHLVAVLLLVMPFVQYFGYLSCRHWIAVIAPMALALAIYIGVGVFSPRTVFRSEPDYRRIATPLLVVGICMLIALAMPKAGITAVMQGVLIDILGLLAAVMLIRYVRARSNRLPRSF